jgi:hypothetical protein
MGHTHLLHLRHNRIGAILLPISRRANARNGTDRVSKTNINNRRKRDRQREREGCDDGENLLIEDHADYNAHIAAIDRQLAALGGTNPNEATLAELEAQMNGETPIDAPATERDTEGLRRHLTRHPSATPPTSPRR